MNNNNISVKIDEIFESIQQLKDDGLIIDTEQEINDDKKKDLLGYKGKGIGINFKWFCIQCYLEFKVDLPQNKCWQCHQNFQ